MSHSNDDKGGKRKPEDAPPGSDPSGKRSGRATFDSRGNSIWEWQLETGVYSRDVNTQKLKKLDLGELSIAESGVHPRPTGLGSDQGQAAPQVTPGRPAKSGPAQGSSTSAGFNPYDSSSSGSGTRIPAGGGINPYDSQGRSSGAGGNPYDNARAASRRFDSDPPPERRRTPADLRKLDQQIKEQRKKLKE